MATYYMWTGSGVTARANSTAYTSGARVVIALTDTSTNYLVVRRYVLECTTGGTTGAAVPAWSASYTPDVSTITDGTVVWTVRNPGYSSGSTVNWTFATIYFDYAIRAANLAGDTILIHYTSQEELTASATYTFVANVQVISVNKDSNNAPTPMSTGGWIGNSTTGRSISIAGGFNVYLYGVTFRSSSWLSISGTDLSHYEFESCYMWQSAGATHFRIGPTTGGNQNSYVRFYKSTLAFGSIPGTLQGIVPRSSRIVFEDCTFLDNGSTPMTGLFRANFEGNPTNTGGPDIDIIGCDLSTVSATLVADFTSSPRTFRFSQCKLNASSTILSSQTAGGNSGGVVYLQDCSSGDTHIYMGYYSGFGSCVSDTGIYFTSGSAAQSWKITTNSACSYYTPFVTPIISWYNNTTGSITPYFEILRDGSSTAFQDDEVWAEFFAKTTSGSTKSTKYSDRMTPLGTPQNQAGGLGTTYWTGEQVTAWSGKLDSGSSITIQEIGSVLGRVVVGEPSVTVYVDPQVRV